MPTSPSVDLSDALVSVVLPTYNEALNIGPLLDGLRAHIQAPLEMVVVDDDSPDGTWQRAEDLARSDPRIRVIRRVGERGLTSAIQRGIDASRGAIVVWLDCDLSMPPEAVPLLLAEVQSARSDIAVGSRFIPGGSQKSSLSGTPESPVVVALSSGFNRLLRWWLLPSFHDFTSGFIAARRCVLQDLPLRGDYGEYFIDLIYRAVRRGYRVVEVPYQCVPRRFGASKTAGGATQTLRRGVRYLWTALRLRVTRP